MRCWRRRSADRLTRPVETLRADVCARHPALALPWMPGPDDAVGDTYTQSGGEKSMRDDSSVWRPAECGIISDTRVQSSISLVVPRCSRHYNASLSLLGG